MLHFENGWSGTQRCLGVDDGDDDGDASWRLLKNTLEDSFTIFEISFQIID